jgi:acetyl-CoA carboxylase biotin carboxyl carrier protein
MNAKELKNLIEFLIEKDIAEFELERGDLKMRMKRVSAVTTAPGIAYVPAPGVTYTPPAVASTPVPRPAASAAAGVAASPGPAEDAELHILRSPIVGTFYEAASPGAQPFVQVGDTVQNGQVLCIVEAMKLMNEIESDAAGSIVKRFVENAQPVEYGQPLFGIRVS